MKQYSGWGLYVRVLIVTLIIVAILALFGCSKSYVRTGPVESNCPDACYTSCLDTNGGTGVYWTADPESIEAWDSLVTDVVIPLITKLQTCEIHRKSCVQCLQNLKDEKVIK